MLNPLITSLLFLVASISGFIAALISVSNESSMDNVCLVASLICGLVSIAMFRKHKRSSESGL
jgi:hypothetical protein